MTLKLSCIKKYLEIKLQDTSILWTEKPHLWMNWNPLACPKAITSFASFLYHEVNYTQKDFSRSFNSEPTAIILTVDNQA